MHFNEFHAISKKNNSKNMSLIFELQFHRNMMFSSPKARCTKYLACPKDPDLVSVFRVKFISWNQGWLVLLYFNDI